MQGGDGVSAGVVPYDWLSREKFVPTPTLARSPGIFHAPSILKGSTSELMYYPTNNAEYRLRSMKDETGYEKGKYYDSDCDKEKTPAVLQQRSGLSVRSPTHQARQ